MFDLVGNPEDCFSRVAAHIYMPWFLVSSDRLQVWDRTTTASSGLLFPRPVSLGEILLTYFMMVVYEGIMSIAL